VIEAGQFITSQLKLADAWGWNRETVHAYLSALKSANQISYKTSNKYTLVTITNWDRYQNSRVVKPATDPAPNPASNQHQIRHKQ
jgi:hypothetical protein